MVPSEPKTRVLVVEDDDGLRDTLALALEGEGHDVRVAENGREAESLAELSLPAEATIDPFSGAPLLLNRRDNKWIVYSVGDDGKDDGGLAPKDYGVGLQEEPR